MKRDEERSVGKGHRGEGGGLKNGFSDYGIRFL